MNKRNYALMAVLYDTKEADLYHDIYFPIIKYAIATLCSSQNNIEKYYDLTDLQNEIILLFGINIPLIVLKQSIKAVSISSEDISLSIYEKGSKFQIKKSWDVELQNNIDSKLTDVISHFDKLEEEFQLYLKKESITSDKTFLDFFTDNTEEIFRYIDQLDSIPIINENYIHIARFLSDLNKKQNELFIVANNIFWGSVISAFLKRQVDLSVKPVDQVRYYLDSSLLMAILDLDSEANVLYGNELLNIIKASGNRVHVHPLTLKEVNSILYSVENSGVPNTNSSIESAYYRRSLSPSLILKIRSSLSHLVEEKGIFIDFVPDNYLEEIQISYRKKPIVQELKKSRSNNYSENIRDVHDIYMNDFVKNMRGDIFVREKINSYFVSLNTDLMEFLYTRERSHFPTIIHPSKIVSELWIHNSQCTLVKKNGLLEVLSRCIALNNTDVRRKLRSISKYFDDDIYSEENYIALYKALISRSKRVLDEVSQIDAESKPESNITSKSHLSGAIRIALEEDAIRTKKISEIESQYNDVHDNLEKLKEEVLFTKSALLENEKQKETLAETKQRHERLIADLNLKIFKHEKLKSIEEEILIIDKELLILENQKESSIKTLKYWCLLVMEILCCCFLGLCLFYLGFLIISSKSMDWDSLNNYKGIVSIVTVICSILIGSTNAKNLYIFSPYIHYHLLVNDQVRYWEDKNPRYKELKAKRDILKADENQMKIS